MAAQTPKPRRHFTEQAIAAATAARRAKAADPDRFGRPELFIVKAGDHGFTWELRRFGGVMLQRGAEIFTSQTLARIDGQAALSALCGMPDQPTFKRQVESRAATRSE